LLFTEDEQNHVLSLIAFLEIFKEKSKKLEADTTPTLQMVLESYYKLLKHCNPTENDTPGIRKLRARGRTVVKEEFVIDDLHKIACLLWPRYRYLRMLGNEEEKTRVK